MVRTISLDSLPFELLSQIASSLDRAKSLLSLSLTCRNLQNFVVKEGWHAFVSGQFSRYGGPPLWREAAHSLTSLSRSWDKRALNAQFILPVMNIEINHVYSQRDVSNNDASTPRSPRLPRPSNALPPTQPRHRRQAGSQTMGYHPCIDCTEQWLSNTWADREETVAIGAGAEILIRNRFLHTKPTSSSLEAALGAMKLNQTPSTNDHGHTSYWRSWRDDRFTDGKDDVPTLKIINRLNDNVAGKTDMIVGRVGGSLERVLVGEETALVNEFITGGRSVRSMNLSDSGSGLLAAGLGNKDVAMYKLDSAEAEFEPVDEISVLCEGKASRTWSTQFLSPDRLAVGYGMSESPLNVYEIRSDGISREPLRQFPALREAMYAAPAPLSATKPSDAVYSIAPVSDSSRATNRPSQVFCTGWYSGAIRLHDMRSPEAAVARFADPLEAGAAVYSILPVGMDRILAGTALHAKMQVFDLRMHSRSSPVVESKKNGYSLFLARDYKSSRKESSVYSLAMSSPFSPTVYAGLEGSIMQMDLFSSTDRHPDPVYRPTPMDNRTRSQREKYYASLAMMDYNGSNKLWIQRYFGRKHSGVWDDRWLELA